MGSLLDTPIPPLTAAQRREMEENMPLEFRQARRRKRPGGTILTSGLNVDYPPTPPIQRLASDDEEERPTPPPPPPEEPVKPAPKPEQPKPEEPKPEEPKPEKPEPEKPEPEKPDKACEHIHDQLVAVLNEQDKNSEKINITKQRVKALKEEIDRLYNVPDIEPPPVPDRRSGRVKGIPPFIDSIIKATDSESGLSRRERIVKASKEIDKLEAKLETLDDIDRQKRVLAAEFSRNLQDCLRGNNGSGPDR